MAISATITEFDGQTVDVTISEGVGPAGPDASVTNANVNTAIATDPAATRTAMVVAEIKEVTLSTTPGDGAANAAAIQSALDDFKHVRLTAVGVAEVSATCTIYADQTLEGVHELTLKKIGNIGELFLNEAAYTYGELDENIVLRGLNIDADDTAGRGVNVKGMNGHLGLCRVKNVLIEDVQVLNSGTTVFSVHVSEWENVTVRRLRVTGEKGLIQFQAGKTARIYDYIAEATDDGIAFNAWDYSVVTTRFGHISDVVIHGMRDQPFEEVSQNGNMMRCLPAGWDDWSSGEDYWQGSTVVNAGHIYVCTLPDATPVTAANAPVHTGWLSTGNDVTGADGIPWRYMQPVTAEVDYISTVTDLTLRDAVCVHNAGGRNICSVIDSPSGVYPNYRTGGQRGFADNIVIDAVRVRPASGAAPASTVLTLTGWCKNIHLSNCYIEKPNWVISTSGSATDRTDTTRVVLDNVVFGTDPVRWVDVQEAGKTLELTLKSTSYPGGAIVRAVGASSFLRVVESDVPFLLTDVTSKEIGDKLKQTTGWREWSGTQWRALGFDPLSEGYRYRRMPWFQPSGPTWSSGTGATTSLAIPEEGRADCGTALGGYAKVFAQTGVSGFSAFSGAAWSFETAGAVEVSAALVVSSNAASRARLMVGVENTRVAPLADSDALSANGLGLEIRRTASQWEARLVSYSSSTFTASSWAQIQSDVGGTMRSLRIDWDGLGNATLRASTVGGSRGTRALASTPIATLTGTVPTTAAGRGAMWEVVNPASGTAANFQTHVLPINFVTEPN